MLIIDVTTDSIKNHHHPLLALDLPSPVLKRRVITARLGVRGKCCQTANMM
jgi:hypothetical protein